MAKDTSARTRVRAPHPTETSDPSETTRTATIINALKQRAQAVLNDKSIDPQSRAIIRYGLETNDPWLAELVRRAEAGEAIVETTLVDTVGLSTHTSENGSSEHECKGDDPSGYGPSEHNDSAKKIETLAAIICRPGDEPEIKSGALLVLLATLENSSHPKALANAVKHIIFTHCADPNLQGLVDAQIAVLERKFFTACVG
ncbi:MAG: hypothetical protein LC794_08800 [Acidobacteria bacterium]|nr:hypothetical protein [Acidobacteriota bacterium]